MSFLLDALRKSENQKHLGQTPTIHNSSVLETRTSANRRLGLVLVVLLPALIVLAWFGFSDMLPRATPAGRAQEPLAATQLQPPVAGETAAQQGNPLLAVIPTEAAEKIRLDTSRTPVETYSEPSETARPEESQPARTQTRGPQTVANENTSNQNNDFTRPVKPVAEPLKPAQAASKPLMQELEVISYWQLPESTRSQLVDMRISVMVYSENPKERFILMNGKRLMVGDEPQAGLVLEEIRREGAVFSFRLYRFLVKR